TKRQRQGKPTKHNISFRSLPRNPGRRIKVPNHGSHSGKFVRDQRCSTFIPHEGHDLGGEEGFCEGVLDISADVSCCPSSDGALAGELIGVVHLCMEYERT